ncbi:MAG: hypothetical protein LBL21_02410 [Rickettsiales bacterium]|jgi:hypothetical protein|nr:hypothetical protein [Rickettsiales bacterium]
MMNRRLCFAVLCLLAAPLHAAQYGREMAQMMALQASADAITGAAQVSGELPVRILELQLENEIRAGNHAVTLADLEKCKFVYPNGSFAWGVPTMGTLDAGNPVCVAEVHLKYGEGVPSDTAVAVAYVAAGGSANCNIGDFPEDGYLPAVEQVTFPADREPTIEEVEKAMDKEQKQNAGIKALSAAVIGGAGMFFAAGDAGMGKKVAATAAGAAGMGGLAYASTQAGKVAGDTIMSAGMNAAAGAVVGNMSAGMAGGGDSILLIKDCLNDDGKSNGQKCLWGYIATGGYRLDCHNNTDVKKGSCDASDGSTSIANTRDCWYNKSGTVICKRRESSPITEAEKSEPYETVSNYSNLKYDGSKDVSSMTDKTWVEYFKTSRENVGCFERGENHYKKGGDTSCGDANRFVKIDSGTKGAKHDLAMVVDFGKDGFFGTTMKDYNANKPTGKSVVGRKPDGSRNYEETGKSDYTVANFTPLTVSADDDEVIDFQNKARRKGTMIGAGTGAAVGALASFQGAKAEVQERYLVELEKYEGSLKNFYCTTGNRYLGKYNETIMVAPMK